MRISIIGLLGFVFGWTVLILGILTTRVGFGPYLSLASLFITIGGTTCAAMIGAPTGFLQRLSTYIRVAFSAEPRQYESVIENLVSLSDKARKDGLLALEDEIVDIPDEFMRKGLQMVIDGADPDIIKHTLTIQIEEMQSRHEQVQNTFELIGKVAPAFGLIGTIIGLIALLGNIGGEPTAIGRGMQVALVTTLYGAVIANLVIIPIANRLREVDVEEIRYYYIVIEGVISIQTGENPRIVRDRLVSFLSAGQRMRLVENEGS